MRAVSGIHWREFAGGELGLGARRLAADVPLDEIGEGSGGAADALNAPAAFGAADALADLEGRAAGLGLRGLMCHTPKARPLALSGAVRAGPRGVSPTRQPQQTRGPARSCADTRRCGRP